MKIGKNSRIYTHCLHPLIYIFQRRRALHNIQKRREAFIIIEQELNNEYKGSSADLAWAIGLCLDLDINEKIPLAVRLYMDAYRRYD